MSGDPERISVPTNGKGPRPGDGPAPADDDALSPDEPSLAFTPTQLAVGFGILASLVLLLVGRMRRRRGPRRGGFGGR